jgi:hypothetical protein
VSETHGEAADRRERSGIPPLGPAAILAQSPENPPARTKRSPAPAVHAASFTVRRELRNAYFLFVATHYDAVLEAAPFPLGCFPPALPSLGGRSRSGHRNLEIAGFLRVLLERSYVQCSCR